MPLIYKIAFRNLFRHKGRSIAIGFVIFTGAFFMTLGNGTITGMQKGMERNVIKGSLGDITLLSQDRMEDNLANSLEPLGIIDRYEEIKKVTIEQDYVDRILPVIWGFASGLDMSMGQSGADELTVIAFLGSSPEKYREMYGDNIIIVEGETLKGDERGILINTMIRENIYNTHNVWIVPEKGSIVKENLTDEALAEIDNLTTRSDLVLMGISSTATATDVRVPVKGIFKFKHMNEIWGGFNIMDLESSRECMGFISLEEMVTDLSAEDQALLEAVDEDPESLFSEDPIIQDEISEPVSFDSLSISEDPEEKKTAINHEKGAYTIAQVNLKKDVNLKESVERLNRSFRERNLDGCVRAVSWRDAWAVLSGYEKTFGSILLIFVYIVYFAAILMMANTLSMAAVERTTEIGTMRTIGVQRRFVSGMFVAETSLLSLLFGGLGIVIGIAAIIIIAAANITTTVPALQLLFGGSVFAPLVDINGLFKGIIQLLIITLIAIIYPVIVARRIKPIDAIRRD